MNNNSKLRQLAPPSHHIKDERVDVKVGLLLHVVDDAALDQDAATLHLQAGRFHARHLEALQVAEAPRQNLKARFKARVREFWGKSSCGFGF